MLEGELASDVDSVWLHDRLPQATVVMVPNSGHFPHLIDPDGFAALLADTASWRPALAGTQ